jgi:hypothetical protein
MENKMSKYTPPEHGTMFTPEYKTRSGRAVRISFVEGAMIYGHVARKNDPLSDFHWEGCRWTLDTGSAVFVSECFDLFDVPKTTEFWVNIYEYGGYCTQEEANHAARTTRVACVRVEHPEGEYI